MSKRTSQSSKKQRKVLFSLLILVVAAVIALSQGGKLSDLPDFLFGDGELPTSRPSSSQNISGENGDISANEEDLKVYFLKVGQADCTVATLPNGETMVIDAGNNSDGKKIVAFLQELGVKKIDYLIGTHPHEDHIGGLDDLIEGFSIGKVYLPRVADDMVPTTKTYTEVLEAVVDKGKKVTTGKAGMTILQEDGITISFLAPTAKEYGDLNSYSIVVRLTYGERSFLFMGDAEIDSEELILDSGADVRADILKLGHHGSSTSSSKEFLDAVNPVTVMISCGKDNDYGHPHREILQMIKERKLRSYRTDTDGTVCVTCDGKGFQYEMLDADCDGSTE